MGLIHSEAIANRLEHAYKHEQRVESDPLIKYNLLELAVLDFLTQTAPDSYDQHFSISEAKIRDVLLDIIVCIKFVRGGESHYQGDIREAIQYIRELDRPVK